MPEDRVLTETKSIALKTTDRILHPRFSEPFKTTHDLYMEGWSAMDAWIPIALYHRKGCLVEIGVGESTFFMCKHGKDHDRDVYSIDLNSGKLKDYNYHKYFAGHYVMWGDSREITGRWDKPIAVMLIDGTHDYEIAKTEFANMWPHVVEGGMVFIHDTYPPQEEFLSEYACGDVWKFRKDLEKRQDEMDILTLPYTGKWCGVSVIIKKEKERPYWGE